MRCSNSRVAASAILLLLVTLCAIGCRSVIPPEESYPNENSPDSEQQQEETNKPQIQVPSEQYEVVVGELDEDHPENMVYMKNELCFTWTGLQLQDGLSDVLQKLIFRARFITGLFKFGDMVTDFDLEDSKTINGQTLYHVAGLRCFDSYDGVMEFVRGTYSGEAADRFLLDQRYVLANGKLYAANFGFGSLSLDTGSYSANVLAASENHVVIELSIERIETDRLYNDVSIMEFELCDSGWRITKQGFEP